MLDSQAAPASGVYTLTAEAWANGELLDQSRISVDLPEVWQVSPPAFTLRPGQAAELPFVVRNNLNDASAPFTYTIAGYRLDMSGRLSPQVAQEGQAVTVTLAITNASGLGQPTPLTLRLAGAGNPRPPPSP